MKRDRATRFYNRKSRSRDRATNPLRAFVPHTLRLLEKGYLGWLSLLLENHLDTFLLRSAMGISGLLPLLKPIHKNKHLSEFSGKTIAVDAYGWLHKGVYACAPEVATGKKTTKCVLLLSEIRPKADVSSDT